MLLLKAGVSNGEPRSHIVEGSSAAQVHSEAQSNWVVLQVVVTDYSSETSLTLGSSQAGVSSSSLRPEASSEAASQEAVDERAQGIKVEKGSPPKAAGATAPLALPEEFSLRRDDPDVSSSDEDD